MSPTEPCPGTGAYARDLAGNPAASCPVCGRWTSLLKSGAIRRHNRQVPIPDPPAKPEPEDRLPLYLVTLVGEPSSPVQSVVVAAPTPYRARVLASNDPSDPIMAAWLVAKVLKLCPVSVYRKPKVILRNRGNG